VSTLRTSKETLQAIVTKYNEKKILNNKRSKIYHFRFWNFL